MSYHSRTHVLLLTKIVKFVTNDSGKFNTESGIFLDDSIHIASSKKAPIATYNSTHLVTNDFGMWNTEFGIFPDRNNVNERQTEQRFVRKVAGQQSLTDFCFKISCNRSIDDC